MAAQPITRFDCAKEAIRRLGLAKHHAEFAVRYVQHRMPQSVLDEIVPPDEVEALIAEHLQNLAAGWKFASETRNPEHN